MCGIFAVAGRPDAAELTQLGSGYRFTEGPASNAKGEVLRKLTSKKEEEDKPEEGDIQSP